MNNAQKKVLFYDCVSQLLEKSEESLQSASSMVSQYKEDLRDLDVESWDYTWKNKTLEEYIEKEKIWKKLIEKLEGL